MLRFCPLCSLLLLLLLLAAAAAAAAAADAADADADAFLLVPVQLNSSALRFFSAAAPACKAVLC